MDVADVRDLEWKKFSEPGIFNSVRNIAKFRLVVKLGYTGRWQENKDEARKISQKLYYHLLRTLHACGFHQPEDLEVLHGEGKFRISYADPEYGFIITVTETGWVEVERDGSSLERFHEWYVSLMPAMQNVLNTIRSCIREELGESAGLRRADSDELESIAMQQAHYEFQIIGYRFRRANSRESSVNSELMKRAFVLLPDAHGRLAPSGDQDPKAFGRISYMVNRWVGPEEAKRRENYQVSAPSNNEWSSLWFTFTYIGDSFVSPEGVRSPFSEKDFVSPKGAVVPYVDFFRDRAIRGFVATLTDGYEFVTTPDILP
ncbi:hypothetical protein WIS52_25705 [Pseudonocardia nematodicida]|uniref:Uncharacterized protein n=1 Tax=Pseudonocardia nematodicida TaxID=1206997 RepID=A0ABV1KHF2_9PSEU